MNWRTTAGLFVVLLLLAGGIYLTGRQEAGEEAPAPTAAATGGPLFPAVGPEAVTRLKISRQAPDAGERTFVQENGIWMQTVPTRTMVLSQTMVSNVRSLLALSSRRTLDADESAPSTYGLDEPHATIVLSVQAGGEESRSERHTLFVGRQTPAEDAYYVQLKNVPRIHLVTMPAIDNMLGLLDDPPHSER